MNDESRPQPGSGPDKNLDGQEDSPAKPHMTIEQMKEMLAPSKPPSADPLDPDPRAGAAELNGEKSSLNSTPALRGGPGSSIKSGDTEDEKEQWDVTQVGGVSHIRADQMARHAASFPPLETLPLLGRAGYIGRGLATLISAYPKVGKTSLLTALLGEWGALGLRVVVLSEESPRTWGKRLSVLDVGPEWANVRIGYALNATQQGHYQVTGVIRGDQVDVIVIDTLRGVLYCADEQHNSQVAETVKPVIRAAADEMKTLVCIAHQVKAGGEHGRGIAGGHALLGLFDAALEVERVPGIGNRRRISLIGRLLEAPDLLYEKGEDGVLRALGSADAVIHIEVRERVHAVLEGAGWLKLKEIFDGMDEPRPGREGIRLGLKNLVDEGLAERDPPDDRKGGRAHKWRLLELTPTGVSLGGSSTPSPESNVSNGEVNQVDTLSPIAMDALLNPKNDNAADEGDE